MNKTRRVFLESLLIFKDYCFCRLKKRAQNLSTLHRRNVEALTDFRDCHTRNIDSMETERASKTI